MIEIKVLKSILKNDSSLAFELWINQRQELTQFLKKTKLKHSFYKLLSINKFQKIDGLENLVGKNEELLELKHESENKISNELDKYQIRHVLFKGAALSRVFYSKNLIRYYTDLDILVNVDDINNLYAFLDYKNYKHSKNFNFIHRAGYTRTALEVIKAENNLILDIHHRIFSKFFSSRCEITNEIFENVEKSEGIFHTSTELNLCITLYHSLIQDNRNTDLNFLVDFQVLNSHTSIDHEKLFKCLMKFNLMEHYNKSCEIVNLIMEDTYNKDLERKLIEIQASRFFNHKFFNTQALKTQLYHLYDPEPYLNIVDGKPSKNYFKLIKYKIKRLFMRLF